MSRVNIKGQFNLDNFFTAYRRGKVQVDREHISLPFLPSNWNAFCDAVDDALTSVSATKMCCRFYGILLFLTLIAFIIVTVFLPQVSSALKGALNTYVKLSYVIPTAVLCILVWYFSRRRLTRAMHAVQRICEEESIAGTVRYELVGHSGIRYGSGDQWLSPFKTERKYFIMVYLGNDAELRQQPKIDNARRTQNSEFRTHHAPKNLALEPKPSYSEPVKMTRSGGSDSGNVSSAELL